MKSYSVFHPLTAVKRVRSCRDWPAHLPLGQYALIDYLHFKGSGLNPAERYHNMGWGLKQVVAEMLGEVSLQQFVEACTAVLDRRISNAPAERRESRWRAGWHNRLQSYLPPAN